jgi:glycosyltransferase involved in cell wall biosynthesis
MSFSGGTFVYFKELSTLIAGSGHKLTICVRRQYAGEALAALAKTVNARLVVRPNTGLFMDIAILFFCAFWAKAGKIVVSAGSPGFHSYAFLFKTQSIHIYHSAPGRFLDKRTSWLFKNYFYWPHRIVAVSNYAKECISKYFAIPSKSFAQVHAVYNGVRDHSSERRERNGKVYTVLTLGHVIEYKNPATWVKAAKYVTSRMTESGRRGVRVRFLWAGDGPDLMTWKAAVSSYPNIEFLGYEKATDVLLESASVYYQPSRMESFGLAVAEAMSFGLPCVVSNCGGLPEVVANGVTGYLCDPENYKAQGDAIVKILQDRRLWKEMSTNARARYDSHFRYEIWAEKLGKEIWE